MNFEDIMREITRGLTGDQKSDTKYLMEQMEKYKEHELAREILRACGRLLFKCIPEDEKAEFEQAINNDMSWHSSSFQKTFLDLFPDYGQQNQWAAMNFSFRLLLPSEKCPGSQQQSWQ